MNILTIPARNLRRKWLRTAVLAVVFAAGILSVVSLNYVSKVVGEEIERKLSEYGANIILMPKVDSLAVSYGGLNLASVSYDIKSLKEDHATHAVREIHHKDRIRAVAPKLVALGKASIQRPVGVIGVIFDEEMNIKSDWVVTGEVPKDDAPQAVAGSKAAQTLGLSLGETIDVEGQPFTVTGILAATGSEDDNVVFAPLHAVQAATGRPNQVSFIEVAALCSGCPIEDIVEQIAKHLPNVEINAMQRVVKQRMYTVEFVKNMALLVSVILLVTACFMISLSLLAAVNERKHEIGLLRSLGYSRSKVFGLFAFEAVVIGLLAGLLGYVGGFQSSFLILRALELGDGASLAFEPLHLLATLGAVILVSVAASILPAYKAATTDPSQALVML